MCLSWGFVRCWALWTVEAAIKERFTSSEQNPSVFTPSVPHTQGCYRLRPGAAHHSGPHSLSLFFFFSDSEWPLPHKSATHTASGEVRGIRASRQAFSPSVSALASPFVLGSFREALWRSLKPLPHSPPQENTLFQLIFSRVFTRYNDVPLSSPPPAVSSQGSLAKNLGGPTLFSSPLLSLPSSSSSPPPPSLHSVGVKSQR